MLDQYADQDKDKKRQKLKDFLVHLDEHLKSAKEFKTQHPDREDLNALIELNLAVQEEAKAVGELVEVGDDCSTDWEDLEEARGSLTSTLARIDHSNWIAQGPSSSRRFNQLFFHIRGDGDSAKGAIVISELLEVSKKLLDQDLSPAHSSCIRRLSEILEGDTGAEGYAVELLQQLQLLEDLLDLSLFDQSSNDTVECAVCAGELASGLDQCPHCGAPVLNLEQPRLAENQPEKGSSQLLDSLWDNWNRYQLKEIDKESLLDIFENLSKPILGVVQKLDSPSPLLVDFSNKLETFIRLSDRNSLELHWPALIASGRALIDERVRLASKR